MHSPPIECYLRLIHNMESVGDDIAAAVNAWLNEIDVLEVRLQKLGSLKMRIHRTISQIQYEGTHSIPDMGRLQYIGDLWVSILELIISGDDPKELLRNILQLFDAGEISMYLTCQIILTIFKV